MTDLTGASNDERLDLLIDRVLASRAAGNPAMDGAIADPGPDAALVVRLSRLSEIDWPVDEVGDRVAAKVAAAVSQHGSTLSGSTIRTAPGRRRPRARNGQQRRRRSRLLAVAAAAAAVLLAAGVVQLGGHPLAPARHGTAAKKPGLVTRAAPTATTATPQTWLTAMRLVSQPGSLQAIGTASIASNFLTCVSGSVCYTLGSLNGGGGDIARSVDGGATWSSGAPLPPVNGQFDTQVEVSCPQPLACFLPYGTQLLTTTDGYAHFQLLPVTMPSGAAGQVSAVACPTTQHCVAAVNLSASSQPFLYSDNGGVSWTAASSPAVSVDDVIGGLRCDPDGACIAAVITGTASNPLVAALSSTDGGQSWTMSPTYSMVSMVQYMVSCADGSDCLVGSSSGYLAWIKASPGGQISIRVQPPPGSWTANIPASTMTVYDVSCATGSDCFVDMGSAELAATEDGGVTWALTPLDPRLPQDNAVYMSCPVAAGCVALASDGSGSQSWAVLSDLPG